MALVFGTIGPFRTLGDTSIRMQAHPVRLPASRRCSVHCLICSPLTLPPYIVARLPLQRTDMFAEACRCLKYLIFMVSYHPFSPQAVATYSLHPQRLIQQRPSGNQNLLTPAEYEIITETTRVMDANCLGRLEHPNSRRSLPTCLGGYLHVSSWRARHPARSDWQRCF